MTARLTYYKATRAILLATGADPDDPRHLNPGEALRAVEELREDRA